MQNGSIVASGTPAEVKKYLQELSQIFKNEEEDAGDEEDLEREFEVSPKNKLMIEESSMMSEKQSGKTQKAK